MASISIVGVIVRATLLLAFTLSVPLLLRRTSASLRRCLVLFGLLGVLALPIIAFPIPGRPVLHVSSTVLVGHVVAEALSPAVMRAPPQVSSGTSAPTPSSSSSVRDWLLAVWAIGAGLVIARMLYGAAWARSVLAGAERRALANADIRVSSRIEAPVVIGIFRPSVLLPPGSREWSEERMRAVLLHELAHVRQRDGIALFVAQLTCILYWFHPLAWMARTRLRRECELAADEAVIAAGLRPSSYAQHLLEIARAIAPLGGIAMAARPSELARRIEALVARDRLPASFTRTQASLLGAASLIVSLAVACVDTNTSSGAKPALATAGAPATAPAVASNRGLDARLQTIADDEARRLHSEWGPARVAVVILDPHTGAVLANSDDAPGQSIVPASTLKPLTIATALDAKLITAEQRFDCGNGARSYGSLVLRDAGEYGSLSTAQILAVSSNIGVSRIFDVLGGARLGEGLRRFHVDAPAEIPSSTIKGAIIAIGGGSTTTPVALASAYGVFANDGVLITPGNARGERVLEVSTATTMRNLLEAAVNDERATGKAAAVPGARVGGKTGTSEDTDCESCAKGSGTFAHFVGIAPIDAPRWVIYVGVGKPAREGSGGTIAAPAFGRVATRALAL